LDVYLLLLTFSVFPIGVESMRSVAIFFGVMTIILTYLFTKEFFNKKYALFTIFLLVINPGFIMGTKIGIHHATIMNALSMTILLCLIKWYRLKRNIYFYLGIFFLGLGMWTRIQFFWLVFGLFLTAAVFRNNLKQRFKNDNVNNLWRYAILGAIFFLLGCLPIVYHECTTSFSTVKLLMNYLKSPLYGVDNLRYFYGLATIMHRFYRYLTGAAYFLLQFQDPSNNFINNLYPWVLLISIVYLIISIILRRELPYKKNIIFLLVLFIGMLIITPISISGYADFHLFLFYPFVQLIISVAVIDFIHTFKKLKVVVITVVVFSIIFIVKEINGVKGYLYLLNKTGGRLYYSPTVYELTDYFLKSKKYTGIIIGSWGLQNVIDVVSGGKIQTTYCLQYSEEQYRQFLQDKTNIYVCYPKEFPNIVMNRNLNNLENFMYAVNQLNLRLTEIKRFYERDSTPIYIIISISQKEAISD